MLLLINPPASHRPLAKTAILCAVSPAACNTSQTLSTLQFATRAKKIVNTAHVNEISSEQSMLFKYRQEIDRLKDLLAKERAGLGSASPLGPGGGLSPDEHIMSLHDQHATEKEEMQSKLGTLNDFAVACKPFVTASSK